MERFFDDLFAAGATDDYFTREAANAVPKKVAGVNADHTHLNDPLEHFLDSDLDENELERIQRNAEVGSTHSLDEMVAKRPIDERVQEPRPRHSSAYRTRKNL